MIRAILILLVVSGFVELVYFIIVKRRFDRTR
jgi:hypothetical protein